MLVAGTICLVVAGSALTLAILLLAQPQRDVSAGVSSISNVINTLVGLLAGFLIGRGQVLMNKPRRSGPPQRAQQDDPPKDTREG